MFGGIGISTGTAIGSAHTVIRAAGSTRHRQRGKTKGSDTSIAPVTFEKPDQFLHQRRIPSELSKEGLLTLVLAGPVIVFLAAAIMIFLAFWPAEEMSAGEVNPEAIARAEARERANAPPPPVYLYSQKVPTKILSVGSYKHIRARVRNQATGAIDSVYLCKKYCGIRHEGTQPGSLLDITWHSYHGADGIYQRVDEAEINRLYH